MVFFFFWLFNILTDNNLVIFNSISTNLKDVVPGTQILIFFHLPGKLDG